MRNILIVFLMFLLTSWLIGLTIYIAVIYNNIPAYLEDQMWIYRAVLETCDKLGGWTGTSVRTGEFVCEVYNNN